VIVKVFSIAVHSFTEKLQVKE
jgi:6-phosphogluconolactonase